MYKLTIEKGTVDWKESVVGLKKTVRTYRYWYDSFWDLTDLAIRYESRKWKEEYKYDKTGSLNIRVYVKKKLFGKKYRKVVLTLSTID